MKKLILTFLAGILLTGCYGAEQKKIKQLEKSGKIPVLDRTDSLAGIDENNNGIRDDIENYINKNYQNENIRKAAYQMARAFQNTLLVDKEDNVAVRSVSREVSRAISCTYNTYRSNSDINGTPSQLTETLESLTTNTKQRLIEYLRYNKALDGTASSLPKGDACE